MREVVEGALAFGAELRLGEVRVTLATRDNRLADPSSQTKRREKTSKMTTESTDLHENTRRGRVHDKHGDVPQTRFESLRRRVII